MHRTGFEIGQYAWVKQAFTRTNAASRRGKFEWNSRRRFFDEV